MKKKNVHINPSFVAQNKSSVYINPSFTCKQFSRVSTAVQGQQINTAATQNIPKFAVYNKRQCSESPVLTSVHVQKGPTTCVNSQMQCMDNKSLLRIQSKAEVQQSMYKWKSPATGTGTKLLNESKYRRTGDPVYADKYKYVKSSPHTCVSKYKYVKSNIKPAFGTAVLSSVFSGAISTNGNTRLAPKNKTQAMETRNRSLSHAAKESSLQCSSLSPHLSSADIFTSGKALSISANNQVCSTLSKNRLIRGKQLTVNGRSLNENTPAKIAKPSMNQRSFMLLTKRKLVRNSSSRVLESTSSKLCINTETKTVRKNCVSQNIMDAALRFHTLKRNMSLDGTHKTRVLIRSSGRSKHRILNQYVFRRPVRNNYSKCAASVNGQSTYALVNKIPKPSEKLRQSHVKVHSYNRFRLRNEKPRSLSSQTRMLKKWSTSDRLVRRLKRRGNYVCIRGALYTSTKTSLKKENVMAEDKKRHTGSLSLLRIQDAHFSVSHNGRTLKRISSPSESCKLSRLYVGGLIYQQTKEGQYRLPGHCAMKHLIHAKQRSLAILNQKKCKAATIKNNSLCLYYTRFGRCIRKEKGECPYVHDPNKVAICTRFLRGRCPVTNCIFSHNIDPAKMPMCSFFNESECLRENCPYRHIKVNPAAPICQAFVKGNCPQGTECKKKHILVCEDFQKTGKCSLGKKCLLSHHGGLKDKKKENVKHLSRKRKLSERFSESSRCKRRTQRREGVLGETISGHSLSVKSNLPVVRYFSITGKPSMVGKDSVDSTSGQDINTGDKSASTDQCRKSSNVRAEQNSCTYLSKANKLKLERLLLKVEQMKMCYDLSTELPNPVSVLSVPKVLPCIPVDEYAASERRFPSLPAILPDFIPLDSSTNES